MSSGFSNLYGVSQHNPLNAPVIPRHALPVVLRQHHNALVAFDHFAQRRPRLDDRALVHEVDESAAFETRGHIRGRHALVLDHDDYDFARVHDEEFVHFREHVDELGRTQLAEAVPEIDVLVAGGFAHHAIAR
jgi:hypothetical protein